MVMKSYVQLLFMQRIIKLDPTSTLLLQTRDSTGK